MNNCMDDMFLKSMIIMGSISLFPMILNLIRLFVSKKQGVENKTFKKITDTLNVITLLMILFTCAALFIDSWTMILIGIRSFIFWVKFDWPIELLFLCSVIYSIYLIWNPKNNSDIKIKSKS